MKVKRKTQKQEVIHIDVVVAQCEAMIEALKDVMNYNECLSYINEYQRVYKKYCENFDGTVYFDELMRLYEELLGMNITVDGKKVANRRDAINYRYI